MSGKTRRETEELAASIVRRMVASAAASGARRTASAALRPVARVSNVSRMLEQLVAASTCVADDVEVSIVRSTRDAHSDFIAVVRGATAPTTRATTVCASWWGLDVTVPHEDLAGLPAAAEAIGAIDAIVARIATANDPAIAPFLQLVAAFIIDTLGLLRVLDRGHGAVICMSWLAPGVLVPSS